MPLAWLPSSSTCPAPCANLPPPPTHTCRQLPRPLRCPMQQCSPASSRAWPLCLRLPPARPQPPPAGRACSASSCPTQTWTALWCSAPPPPVTAPAATSAKGRAAATSLLTALCLRLAGERRVGGEVLCTGLCLQNVLLLRNPSKFHLLRRCAQLVLGSMNTPRSPHPSLNPCPI